MTGRSDDTDPPHELLARRVRRPRMVPFLVTGALLGALAGLLLVMAGPASGIAGPAQELLILGAAGAALGGLLGAIVFLVVERQSR